MLKEIIMKILLKFIGKYREEGELVKNCNLKSDLPDDRDYVVVIEEDDKPALLASVLPIVPTDYVKSQGTWGSCASHAMCTALEISFDINNTNLNIPLSERHHYYNARQSKYMDTFPGDSGMYARMMLQVVKDIGVSPEKLCPYISNEMNTKPGQLADGFANLWKIDGYYRVYDLGTMKTLIRKGFPILVGFMVNSSFYRNTGPIDTENSKIYGGHEVVIYGFDDINKELLCINSCGTNYKDNGCMKVPYKYFEKFGIDMWIFNI